MDTNIIDTETFLLSQTDFMIRILVSIGMGLVIGLEREYTAIREDVPTFAGIRTFISVSLLGFIAGILYYALDPSVFLIIFTAVLLLTAIAYYTTARNGKIGTTSEFSLITCFFLGTLSSLGLITIGLSIMVLVVVLLSAKLRMRNIIGKITSKELYAFLRFVVVALLIFPFLPDQDYGYRDTINPREIGWVIILTSGLGFVGYIFMKILGAKKGILLSAIVGGLVSSTAVTWLFAKQSKSSEELSHHWALGIFASTSVMLARVLMWTIIFNLTLFNRLLLPLLLFTLCTLGVSAFFFLKGKTPTQYQQQALPIKPLDLQSAMVFGLIYVAIMLAVSYANANMGDKGLFISSALAGFSDIDAITIGISKLAGKELIVSTAANALLVATFTNTLVKIAIAVSVGSNRFKKYVLIGFAAVFLAAIPILLFVH